MIIFKEKNNYAMDVMSLKLIKLWPHCIISPKTNSEDLNINTLSSRSFYSFTFKR